MRGITKTGICAGAFAVALLVAALNFSSGEASAATTAPPPTGYTLSVRAYKVKGIQTADLTWTGATGSNVDVYHDGVKVVTTMTDGSYTDSTGQKGSGSHAYKVCNAGTNTCSNTVTTTY